MKQTKPSPYRSVLEYECEDELRQALELISLENDWRVSSTQDVDEEVKRLTTLASLGVLETNRDSKMDCIVEAVRKEFSSSWAYVSFIDFGRQVLTSIANAPNADKFVSAEISRKDAFCAHTILSDETLVSLDTTLDARFLQNPCVTSAHKLRFYAANPLTVDGARVGAVCVVDNHPRDSITGANERLLQDKATEIANLLKQNRDILKTGRKRTNSKIGEESNGENRVPGWTTLSPSSSHASLRSSDAGDVRDLIGEECGKRSRANSLSDVIVRPQLQPLLPSPKTAGVDPDEYLVQLVEALWPGTKIEIKAHSKLDKFFPTITEAQMSRYSSQVLNLARSNDVQGLQALQETNGRDVLDCFNRFGEGLLNLACRRGFKDMVKLLLSSKVSLDVRVRDDYGRTPLHDACWSPEPQLEICSWIIQKDPSLFLVADKRGFTPFQYARNTDWDVWRQFLYDNREHLETLTHSEVVNQFTSKPC